MKEMKERKPGDNNLYSWCCCIRSKIKVFLDRIRSIELPDMERQNIESKRIMKVVRLWIELDLKKKEWKSKNKVKVLFFDGSWGTLFFLLFIRNIMLWAIKQWTESNEKNKKVISIRHSFQNGLYPLEKRREMIQI